VSVTALAVATVPRRLCPVVISSCPPAWSARWWRRRTHLGNTGIRIGLW